MYMDENPDPLTDDLLEGIELVLEDTPLNNYKAKDVKLDINDIKWEKKYKPMNQYGGYDDHGKYAPNYTEQINSLWQENKNLQNQLGYILTVIETQTKVIKEMQEKLESLNSGKFDEINDRLDDIESRIDLIDE